MPPGIALPAVLANSSWTAGVIEPTGSFHRSQELRRHRRRRHHEVNSDRSVVLGSHGFAAVRVVTFAAFRGTNISPVSVCLPFVCLVLRILELSRQEHASLCQSHIGMRPIYSKSLTRHGDTPSVHVSARRTKADTELLQLIGPFRERLAGMSALPGGR